MANPFEDLPDNITKAQKILISKKEQQRRLGNWQRTKELYEQYTGMVTECLTQLSEVMGWNGVISLDYNDDPQSYVNDHIVNWSLTFIRSKPYTISVHYSYFPEDHGPSFFIYFEDYHYEIGKPPIGDYQEAEKTDNDSRGSLIKSLKEGTVKLVKACKL